mgnify:FL=1
MVITLQEISVKILKTLIISTFLFFVYSCASGGSSQTAIPVLDQTTLAPVDERIPFTKFKNSLVTPWGDASKEYFVSSHYPSSNWPSNEKYIIEDYGFLSVTSMGRHPGDSNNPDEISQAGPYTNNAQWFEADLNLDEHTDLIYVGNNCCNRDYVLEDLMLAFINNGDGHFRLAPEIFTDGQFPCVNGGKSWISNAESTLHPCGNQADYTNGKIVADFNGDGISDYYDTSILYLSNSEGKLENRSQYNLPNLFFEEAHGQIFVHDATYGDLDNDGDLDIFVPISDYTKLGFKFGGEIDPCSECTEQIPYTALINDGKGNFSANYKIPLYDYWVEFEQKNGFPRSQLWPTTAAIGDFDNDGFGDIALGWFNPEISHLYGFNENSSGVIYLNNGKNDWTQRDFIELPSNYFGANGNANDMEVFDFNDDGFMDIVLASTIHEPYYESRVIQFFKNDQGHSFIDITNSLSPDHAKYADGNPYSTWWVGQGKLHIIDYDHDGDLDIVDTTTRTSVFINNQTSFDLYDDFVDTDEDVLLWPVEIDGKYHYDFIGSHVQICATNYCTTNFYQLLDPPAADITTDFLSKTNGYFVSLAQASYLNDHLRELSFKKEILSYSDSMTSTFGSSINMGKFSVLAGNYRGLHSGNFIGGFFNESYMSFGFTHSKLTTMSQSQTKWFGMSSADLSLDINEVFLKKDLITTDSLLITVGYLSNLTTAGNFFEEGGAINLFFHESKIEYQASFASFKYGFDFSGYSVNMAGGMRKSFGHQEQIFKSDRDMVFNSDNAFSNEYFSIDLVKGNFYLLAIKNGNTKMRIATGVQFNF